MATADRALVFEERANSLPHGFGLTLSLAGAPLLVALAVVRGHTVWHVAGATIYGACLVLLYACSTIYHSLQAPLWKEVFRIADHSAIFLLIAGTYTPITLISLHGASGWILFAAVWVLSIFGIVYKIALAHRMAWVSTPLYVATGWLALAAINPLVHHLPTGGLVWLFGGGLFYTGGLIFFAWRRFPYNHAVWHMFVLAGSLCHYLAIMLYVVPAHI